MSTVLTATGAVHIQRLERHIGGVLWPVPCETMCSVYHFGENFNKNHNRLREVHPHVWPHYVKFFSDDIRIFEFVSVCTFGLRVYLVARNKMLHLQEGIDTPPSDEMCQPRGTQEAAAKKVQISVLYYAVCTTAYYTPLAAVATGILNKSDIHYSFEPLATRRRKSFM